MLTKIIDWLNKNQYGILIVVLSGFLWLVGAIDVSLGTRDPILALFVLIMTTLIFIGCLYLSKKM